MPATVIIPTTLRMFTAHNSELELDGSTVGEVITALSDEYPETKKVLFGEDGRLREFINVFVGADNIRDLQGYDTPVREGDEIMLIPAIARRPHRRQAHKRRDQAILTPLIIEGSRRKGSAQTESCESPYRRNGRSGSTSRSVPRGGRRGNSRSYRL